MQYIIILKEAAGGELMIYRQEYMSRLRAFKDQKLIKVITGLRRSGKSTLMTMYCDELKRDGVGDDRIQFINFELMRYDDIRDYRALYALVAPKIAVGSKNYLFFDEIQQVSGWEKALNSLTLEYDVDIYVTGSNAYLLSSEIATLISGRYVEIKMLPLSFKEYYGYYKDKGGSREDIFNDYLKYGGLPQLLSLPRDEEVISSFLSSVYDTVIVKDVIARNKIRDVDMLRRVFAFVCDNVGSITSSNSIAKYIAKEAKLDASVRPATIGNILDMFVNAFIIYRAERFDVKGKEKLKSLEKYYLGDIGLKNTITGYSLKNYGHTIENVVFLELLRRDYEVFVGKCDSREIDFVAKKKDRKIYIQVADNITDPDTLRREVAPLDAIDDHYDKLIITAQKTFADNIKGIKIVNLLDFLLS